MIRKNIKKVIVSLIICFISTPVLAFKPDDSTVSAYAKLALQEFYSTQFAGQETYQYKNFNYTSPVIVNTTVSDDFGNKRNVTCVAFQDYSKKDSWGFVIFDVRDKMVNEILSRGGMISDNIHAELKILAKEAFESP